MTGRSQACRPGKRPAAAVGLLVVMAFLVPGALCAQSPPEVAHRWGPNGNGTLAHQDDLLWVLFKATQFKIDEAAGKYQAMFPSQLQQANGKRYRITGYMLAVEPNWTSPHFVLTRYNTQCPFCPPSEPTEAIEIHATRPVAVTLDPVTVTGTLHLAARTDKGLFFRLDGATVT